MRSTPINVLKARTSRADLAMAMKQQEIQERRKKRLEEQRLMELLNGMGERALTHDDVLGTSGRLGAND
jgi:hypothetical protein